MAAVLRDMTDMDRLEFACLAGKPDPEPVLREMVRRSRRSRAAYVDGRLAAVYGVFAPTVLSDEGNPWLVATNAVHLPAVRRAFIAGTTQEFAWLSDGFRRLWNLVHADNAVAIRWLRWMGFRFDADEWPVRGQRFLRFSMEA